MRTSAGGVGAGVLARAQTPGRPTVVSKAVHSFLRSLRERNVSRHTIKAYTQDLNNFAAYVGSRDWKGIDHITIRGFLSRLYEKGLGHY